MAVPQDTTTQGGSLQSTAFFCLCVFIIGIFSAVTDIIRPLGAIRPSLLSGVTGLLILGISGRLLTVVSHKAARGLIALTLWWIICTPFSVWPGGAFRTLTEQWVISFLTFFLVAGILHSARQCLTVVNLIGYSSILLALNSLRIGWVNIEGRLGLPYSRYANPNDLAMVLLAALPFVGLMVLRRGSIFRRLIALGGLAPILLCISKTGSRAALLGAAVALVVVFLHLSFASRVKLIALTTVAIAVLIPVVPDTLRTRFTTIFGDDKILSDRGDSGEVLRASVASAYSRKMLLMDSITLTLTNPLFGVGPGQFPVAQNDLARERGERMGNWHVTHNTYTEVSSESGIPGLLIYVFILYQSFRSLNNVLALRLHTPSAAMNDLKLVAVTMRVALVGFLTCAFFGSIAYLPFISVLVGFAVAVEFCAFQLAGDVRRAQATVSVPQPARKPQNIRGLNLPGRIARPGGDFAEQA